MNGEQILSNLWKYRHLHAEAFKDYGGLKRLAFSRNAMLNGFKCNIEFVFADQNPEGKSHEAKLVREGKLHSSEACWLYYRNSIGKIVWLGKIVKGQPAVLNRFWMKDKIYYLYNS